MPAAGILPITSSDEPAANPSRGPERTLTASDLNTTNIVEVAGQHPIATDRGYYDPVGHAVGTDRRDISAEMLTQQQPKHE